MARRRYRRYRRRSGRWAPNIVKVASTINTSQGEFYAVEDLAQNPIQVSTGVSQAFTVKNFEISFVIETENAEGSAFLEGITAFIMYVPQGMNITANYYAEHPEYIMAYKFLGSPNSPDLVDEPDGLSIRVQERQQFQPYRIRTRLSRKLQTGDRVVLYIQGSNELGINRFNINGIVRWWSKAN